MKLGRAISYVSLAVATLAVIAGVVSYLHPVQATRMRNRPDSCWFFTMQRGKLSFWSQSVVPPPPDASYSVSLSTPFHMRVSGAGSLFTTNFNANWPSADLGWNTVQDSKSVVFGPGGSVYNFSLRVRALVLAWWVIALIALIPLAMRGILYLLHRRQNAYNLET